MDVRCSICRAGTVGTSLCAVCAGLLRWVRGYFAHDPGLPSRVGPETRFVEDLGVESLDWMCWSMEARDKLGVILADERLERIRTVGEFVQALREAGAVWPDDVELRLRPRRGWWSPYRWDIARTGDAPAVGDEVGR